MSDSFQVNTDALSQHAEVVGTARAATDQAAAAAQQVTPGGWDAAYGQICQFFPSDVRPIADTAITAIQKIAQQLHGTQAKLTTTAKQYNHIEQHTENQFTLLRGQLNGEIQPKPSGRNQTSSAAQPGGREPTWPTREPR
jgi:hypothetical protein